MKTDKEIFNDYCKMTLNRIAYQQKEVERIEKSREYIIYKCSVRWNEFKTEFKKTLKIIKGWFEK